MEIWQKIRAEQKELDRVFEYDEVLNIRYIEHLDGELYIVVIRIPECRLRASSHPISLTNLKRKVIQSAQPSYLLSAKVLFSDGSDRIVYACNDYWLETIAKRHGEIDGVTVKEIQKIDNRI